MRIDREKPPFDVPCCIEVIGDVHRYLQLLRNRISRMVGLHLRGHLVRHLRDAILTRLPRSINTVPSSARQSRTRAAWTNPDAVVAGRRLARCARLLARQRADAALDVDRQPFLVNSSVTVRHLCCWPLAQRSNTKSRAIPSSNRWALAGALEPRLARIAIRPADNRDHLFVREPILLGIRIGGQSLDLAAGSKIRGRSRGVWRAMASWPTTPSRQMPL
jgi:hypothetical protein